MLTIPDHYWSQLLDGFNRDRSKNERVAYLDGVRMSGSGESVVTTLTVPRATAFPTYFYIQPEDVVAAGRHLFRDGLHRLAQVHSHPGRSVDHSDYDDGRAYSQRVGAISIVVPLHGRTRPTLLECGIHVRSPEKWVRLSPEDATAVVRQVASVNDLTQSVEVVLKRKKRGRPWNRNR